MAALFASSHPFLFSPNPKPLRLLSPNPNRTLRLSIRNPRLHCFSSPGGGDPQPPSQKISINESSEGDDPPAKPSGIVDEWGERADSEPEASSDADPPRDDDEWGRESTAVSITDEWGEKSDPELEPPSQPDPPVEEDEWGREPVESDKLGDLKRCLVDTFYGTEYGWKATPEVRAEIFELVSQLEAGNPNPAPTQMPDLLAGNWILLYTAFSELLPLVAVGQTPLLKLKKISQTIDTENMTIINATTFSSPFATLSFSATAAFEVRSPSRIQVQFKEGTFQPPEITSTVNLPENIDIFGRKVDLSPVQQYLNPLQEAIANVSRGLSGQPPLKVPIPGERSASWLLTTYLDEDLRISRGDGGLFVLAKEGSPLLNQLS